MRKKVAIYLVVIVVSTCLSLFPPTNGQAIAKLSFASADIHVRSRTASDKGHANTIHNQPLANLPHAFIENRGQTDARATFLAQVHDTAAYFTVRGLTLAFTH